MKKRILCMVSIGLLVSLVLIVAIAYGTNTGTSSNGKFSIENQIVMTDALEPSVHKEGSTWTNLESLNNASVSVKNNVLSDGGESAYIRTVFAFEAGTITDVRKFHDLMCIRVNSNDWTWTDNNNWLLIEIDGENYFMVTATYKTPVQPGGTTSNSLLGIGMDWNADNTTLAGAGFGDGYKILTHSQAVSVDGFGSADDALKAFKAAYGDVTVDDHPWNVTYVSTFEELMKAIAQGKTNIILVDNIDVSEGTIVFN